MLVAVTGATGFVGSRVVERLLRRDHEVRILTRNPERAGWLRDRGVEVVAGGVESQSPLRALVAGAGAVVHLVGIIVEVSGQTFERVHVSGTRNVLGAAREARRHAERAFFTGDSQGYDWWLGVCRALDRPYPAEHPRFRTNHDRLAHRAEILGLLERCFAEEPAAHWIARMAAPTVPLWR